MRSLSPTRSGCSPRSSWRRLLATACGWRRAERGGTGQAAGLRRTRGARGVPHARGRVPEGPPGRRGPARRGERRGGPDHPAVHLDRGRFAAGRVPDQLPLLRAVRRQGRDRAGGRAARRVHGHQGGRLLPGRRWRPSGGAASSCACRRTCPAWPSTTTGVCSQSTVWPSRRPGWTWNDLVGTATALTRDANGAVVKGAESEGGAPRVAVLRARRRAVDHPGRAVRLVQRRRDRRRPAEADAGSRWTPRPRGRR